MKNLIRIFSLAAMLTVFGTVANAQTTTITFTLLNPVCNNDGILVAQTNGITPPVTFNWYTAGGVSIQHTVNSTTDTIFNYSGGYMWVSASGTGGQNYGNFAGAPPFTYSVSTTPAICPANGTATCSVTGGLAPYDIQWSDLQGNYMGSGSPVSLPGGQYQVVITDANGCVSGSYAVGDSIWVDYVSGVVVTANSTPANCTNGTATCAVTGGNAPYSYLWNNGANSQTISGLQMGSYQVTVTDAQGCYGIGYAYVNQSVNITVNTTPTAATCLQNDGSAIAFGGGGVPPYTYAWQTGSNSQTISNMVAGYYSVTVNDANNCIGTGWAYINPSTPITVIYSSTPSQCTSATGTATVNPTGGSAPYTITWNTYPQQTGATATNLSAGTYSFNVTDNVGCVRTGTVVVPPVSIVSASISAADAMCTAANGSAILNITSGQAPFTLLWNTGATTNSITGLVAGGYSCQITDNLGCSINKYATVHASSPISIGFASTAASCIYSADGNIVALPTGGTAPYTYLWSNGQTTNIASGLTYGQYYVYVSDAAGCVSSGWSYCTYNQSNNSCYCTIQGTVYHDLNSNCTQDAGEPGIQNIMIHCSGFGYTYTDANGNYSFMVPSGTYIISENVQYFYPLAPCQNNSISQTVTASSGCTNTIDFANVVNPIHDIHITTLHYTAPIPGFNYQQHIIIKNEGTINETDVVSGYKHDGQLSLSSLPFYTQQAPNWYNIASTGLTLAPAQSQLTTASYNVPTNIPLGTAVQFNDTASYDGLISNWLNDYSPWNNVNAFTAYTVGSWDPNFKEVNPKGIGAPGYITTSDSVLEYTIHFQNTGSYPAQNIYLLDTIDTDLDFTTLHPVYSSHNMTTEISENGIVKFRFDNIMLPDSLHDPLASIGYVIYTIHQKPNLANGTQMKNSASIYFDFNSPVKTNTTLNTIDNGSSVKDPVVSTLEFSLYPNPTTGAVKILVNASNANSTATLKIFDMVGKSVLEENLHLANGMNGYSLDASSLASGMYLVQVSDGNNSYLQKLSIVK